MSQDPDSRLLSDPEADLITAQMPAAAQELALAESLARAAFRRAEAAFDTVSYDTPVLRQQLETGTGIRRQACRCPRLRASAAAE